MRTIRLLILFMFTFFLPLSAQDETQIVEEISKAAAHLISLQCDFTQTKYLEMLNSKMLSKGVMSYQQNNKLRWEYISPYKYVFILNDTKVLLKNDTRNDVIDVNKNKVFKEIARVMMNSVIGKSLTDDKDFKISLIVSGPEYVATLLPLRKDIKAMFNTIVLHFDKTSKLVSKVELVEKSGDRTIIELLNVKPNVSFNQEIFVVN